MKKKYQNMIFIVLNGITLTLFAWLQLMVFTVTENTLGTDMLISMYIVSLLCVPLISWGFFTRIK